MKFIRIISTDIGLETCKMCSKFQFDRNTDWQVMAIFVKCAKKKKSKIL